MLCPEVWNFPSPKILTSYKQKVDSNSLKKLVNMNNFYKSLTVTIPDEIKMPDFIQENLTVDREFYEVSNCLVTAFLEKEFIDNFVKNGALSCLSIVKDCIVDNCVAITPDGVLTLHVIDYIFQCLGMEGTKRPHNFYEIRIDLKSVQLQKLKQCVHKLGAFDFHISWEPHHDNICPSSIAKYLVDKNINVSLCSPQVKKLTPVIDETASLIDVEASEIAEWIGMIVQECDLKPEFDYVSSYRQPESENAIKSSRIAVAHTCGYFTSSLINQLCENLTEYLKSREADNYWVSLSIQSDPNSLWRWDFSRPIHFQSHDSSRTIFFSNNGISVYSVGLIKF